MTEDEFSADDWIDRLVQALLNLAEEQKPYLREYRKHDPRVYSKLGGRDGNPMAFSLNDLRDLYAVAFHSYDFGEEKHYADLNEVLNPLRGILRSHPTLARVMSPIIGRDDFWMRILGSGSSTSLTDLTAGLMARVGELPGDGFRKAATELNAFLVTGREDKTTDVPGDLDVGCDVVVFHGLSLREKLEIGNDMTIVPFEQVRVFVDEGVLEDVAPTVIKYNDWRSVGAVVKPFRWKPEFRRTGYEGNSELDRPGPFFRKAQEFLDLLAVSHGMPVVCLVAVPHCLNRGACRLLGQPHSHGAVYWGRSAHLFNGLSRSSDLVISKFAEAKNAFEERESERYRGVAPVIGRLAEALARGGQFVAEDQVLDVAIALERMFKPKGRNISTQLQKSVADFLGGKGQEQPHMKETVKHFYEVRSAIIHGPKDDKKTRLLEEKKKAFDGGFDLARRSLFKMLQNGLPQR
ncbi:MAG: HEPN domain-containing protein [Candidatus Dadabacteria bacterium]|nr:HEPN domain-containing protein [Candidatus Dadabacteria bacterium]MDE0477119.1 HEPN domain-containing protein [Candidatus Dadabacteria bacterium]